MLIRRVLPNMFIVLVPIQKLFLIIIFPTEVLESDGDNISAARDYPDEIVASLLIYK